MALCKLFTKRFTNGYTATSPAVTLEHSLPAPAPPNAAKTNFHREYLTSPESAEKGFFRRFLHRKSINQLPEFLSIPVGDKMKEKLRGINITLDRLHLDGLAPPSKEPVAGDQDRHGVSVQDVKKLLKVAQMEKVKARLREIPQSSISSSEFVRICGEECGNEDQGVKFAKMLDQAGNVIVLGNIVFIRPEQVAKTMESMISQSIATPNDPRRKQLEQMEKQKSMIDQKARTLVRGELYCGLGFLVIQTLGLMRLTFWELSWDVMEPICFFVTSLHFALSYAFFLRTSTEPSFEGYFHRRFKSKQEKLMKIHNFDAQTYNELRKAFYPNFGHGTEPLISHLQRYKPMHQEEKLFVS